jgi:translation initiation factor IF-2
MQARVEQVKLQLMSEGLELEEYGGDVQLVQTAARKGEGLDALEEALLLQVRVRHCHIDRGLLGLSFCCACLVVCCD